MATSNPPISSMRPSVRSVLGCLSNRTVICLAFRGLIRIQLPSTTSNTPNKRTRNCNIIFFILGTACLKMLLLSCSVSSIAVMCRCRVWAFKGYRTALGL